MTEEKKVHGNTKKAADMALAKKQISPDSHRAIHEGRIELDEAKSLRREGSPFGPATKAISKNDCTPEPCMCGCGQRPKRSGSRWIQGHDARAVGWANAVARGEEIELSKEQREYVERSGKLERAKAQVAKEEAKREEKAAAKAEKQRQKEAERGAKK